MSYKIEVSVNASGYSRGYYEIDEEGLLEALQEAIVEEEVPIEGQLEFAKVFAQEHALMFLGEFIDVRNDMDKEVFVDVVKC